MRRGYPARPLRRARIALSARCPDANGYGRCQAPRAASWHDRYESREPPSLTSAWSASRSAFLGPFPSGQLVRPARLPAAATVESLPLLRLALWGSTMWINGAGGLLSTAAR